MDSDGFEACKLNIEFVNYTTFLNLFHLTQIFKHFADPINNPLSTPLSTVMYY